MIAGQQRFGWTLWGVGGICDGPVDGRISGVGRTLGAWPIRFAGRKKEARGGGAFPEACLVRFGGLGARLLLWPPSGLVCIGALDNYTLGEQKGGFRNTRGRGEIEITGAYRIRFSTKMKALFCVQQCR